MPDEAARVWQVSDWAEEPAATHRQLLARERALKAKEVEIAKAMSDGDTAAAFEVLDLASTPPVPPGSLLLAGPELVAYVRVRAASVAAMAAQQAHEAAGKELRAAIEAMCQQLAPPRP